MHVAIGSDHAGFEYKERLKLFLIQAGHIVEDFGTDSDQSTDYPLWIRPCAEAVAAGEFAVSMFHDENANYTLDRNFLGVPKEGWGTSRDAKANFGPPSYSDARVMLKPGERKQVVVHVRY